MGEILVFNSHGISQYELDICDRKVNKLIRLRDTLGKSLEMESLHDQIVESHWSFRSALNDWSMRRPISNSSPDFVSNHEVRSALNRLAFNVLNLGKLFLNKNFHEKDEKCFAADLTGDIKHKLVIDQNRKNIYENNLEYAVGCKLRGKSQHDALPVRTISYGSRYDPGSKTTSVKLGVYYSNRELKEKKVPAKWIEGIDEMDLTEIIAGYVFALSGMQKLNRNLTKDLIEETRTQLLTEFDEIKKMIDEERECQVKISDNECMSLSLDWFEVHDYLTKKHNEPVKYSQRSIGEIYDV